MTETNNNNRPSKSTRPGPVNVGELMKHLGEQEKSRMDFSDLPQATQRAIKEQMTQLACTAAENGPASHSAVGRNPDGFSLSSMEKVEIHSAEVQEILGYIPNWIIRWGITIIGAIVLMLLAGSWFVKYPDVVTGRIEVTSTNPPTILRARVTGRIQRLMVSDRQDVRAGDYLAVLETTADYRHVVDALRRLEILRPLISGIENSTVELPEFEPDYLLGDLQPAYENLLNNLRQYEEFVNLHYYGTRLASLRAQYLQREQYYNQLTEQIGTLEADFQLTRRQHERSEELHKSQLISEKDYEASQATLLQKEYALEAARLALTTAGLQVSQLNQSIADLQLDSLQTFRGLRADLKRTCDELLGRIMAWEQSFVIKTPIDGVVSFIGFWTENQNVSVGDNVMVVLPSEPTELIGRVELPSKGSGMVRTGQTVHVKFDSYPHTQYGMVEGIVVSRSLIAVGDEYVATVKFPRGLVTGHHVDLPFSQKMQGEAEIVTDDLRLFERIFNRARSFIASSGR